MVPRRFPDRLNTIAVISSETSDSFGDFRTRIGPEQASKIRLYNVTLAGTSAVEAIVSAISQLNHSLDADIICLVRGGDMRSYLVTILAIAFVAAFAYILFAK